MSGAILQRPATPHQGTFPRELAAAQGKAWRDTGEKLQAEARSALVRSRVPLRQAIADKCRADVGAPALPVWRVLIVREKQARVEGPRSAGPSGVSPAALPFASLSASPRRSRSCLLPKALALGNSQFGTECGTNAFFQVLIVHGLGQVT